MKRTILYIYLTRFVIINNKKYLFIDSFSDIIIIPNISKIRKKIFLNYLIKVAKLFSF